MAVFLKLETRDDLEDLVSGQVPESLTLEYKASGAVDIAEGKRREIAKDVSAMANSDGGQIVYGIAESGKTHLPDRVDEGVDRTRFHGHWFEQVIQQNIRPPIEGLTVKEIPLGDGKIAVVLTIPAAGSSAPHQANDNRYYRRGNFEVRQMEDYEVREAMRRTTTPDLLLKPSFAANLHFASDRQERATVEMQFTIANRASEPAFYAVAQIYVDATIEAVSRNDWPQTPPDLTEGHRFLGFQRLIGSNGTFPVFREHPIMAGRLIISVPRGRISEVYDFPLKMRLFWPGGSWEENGFIVVYRSTIRYEPSGKEAEA